MKNLLLFILIALIAGVSASAQITINASDMPVKGDTLRYSIADPALSIDFTTTGANQTWDFSTLVSIAQGVDDYKSAASISSSYAVTISPSAYGIKVADSIPGAPIPVTELYNFFNIKSGPSRFVIEGFAAKVAGIPTPINYSDEDEVYIFPLTFPHTQDNTTFKLSYAMPPLGSFTRQGTRKTDVDGWGTIKTPYTTSPVNVVRVRSEITEIDSFTFGGNTQGLSVTTVEYKWLAKGEHYPLLEINTTKAGSTEAVSDVSYRDTKRAGGLSVSGPGASMTFFKAFPNPAQNSITLEVPASWKTYMLHIYDATGKIVLSAQNNAKINTENLPAGSYIIIAESASGKGVAHFVK